MKKDFSAVLRHIFHVSLLLSFLFICSFQVNAAEIHVPGDYATIHEAINAAYKGDVIIVHEGTYNENISFPNRAITLRSTDPNDPAVVAATVIDGGQAGSVVTFGNSQKADSVLSGFTLKNGKAAYGGGISFSNFSSPTIRNCTITGNTATSNGGGVYCYYFSSPVITDCSISGNSATYGGGISCSTSSSPAITYCSISGNTSSSYGGGIYCATSSSPAITYCTVSVNTANRGGGIYLYASSPKVTNCLITRNSATSYGGGIYYGNGGSPVITNCTLARNTAEVSQGGGIYCSGGTSVTITNCILWSDSAGEVTGTPAITYSAIRGGYAGTGNISDNPSFVDPASDDYHLRADSPCINTGTASGAPDADIEGRSRPLGAGHEMGAYEYDGGHEPPPSEVHVHSGESIQAAINAAYKGDVIIVHEGTYNENISFPNRAITVRSTDPNDPAVVAATVIDGGQAGSVVTFGNTEKADSVLSGFTLKNGKAAYGGGISCSNFSSPTIRNCTITGNTATSNGGGVYCYYFSSPVITDCSISGNSATYGGGIYCSNFSSPTIRNCTITGNTATSNGGGVYCYYFSSPVITDCSISGNSATYGGGIYCESSSSPAITYSTVSGNTANRGGGIYCTSSSPAITGCSINNNTASSYGGGIHCQSSSPVITYCTVSGNTGSHGGGIYLYASSPKVTNCLIARNSATSYGGGIYYGYGGSSVITNCTLARNTAGVSQGGGIYCSGGTSVTITNCILWSDSAGEVTGTPAITYSAIRGGYAGTGNISDNPSFVDPASDDYHLRADSPCINTGTASGAPDADIEGRSRPLGAGHEMGAYEYVDSENRPPWPPAIIAPVNQTDVNTLQPDLVIANSFDPDGEIDLSYEFELYADQEMEELAASATVGTGSGDTTSWTIPVSLHDKTWYYWRVRAADGEAFSEWVYGSFFVRLGAESIVMNLPAGWSMISLPVVPDDATAATIFPGAVAIYRYERQKGYKRVKAGDSLETGRGYWILLSEGKTYTLTGAPINAYTHPVNEGGWAMIGGCSYPSSASATGCAIAVIYGYTPGAGYQRVPSENLVQGKGYWILLNNVGEQAELRVEGN